MSKVSLPKQQEKKLVAAAKQNIDEFGPLYEHYYSHIRRYFAVKLMDAAVIEDLTAQVFEKAMSKLASFEWRGYPFSAWLYRIAHNSLIDYYRKSAKSRNAEEWEIETQFVESDTYTELVTEWRRNRTQELMTKLKPRDRRIVELKFYSGHTNKKIAEITGLTETNVGSILHRALQKLREFN